MENQAATTNKWNEVDKSDNPSSYVKFLDITRSGASKFIQANPKQFFAEWKVQEGFQILDVGCGTGDLIWPVATLVGNSGRLVGIDNSQTMIDKAKRRTADVRLPIDFQLGDAEHLNFEDNTFDIANAVLVFTHLAQPRQTLSEMVRVTKPGGLICVSDVDWETLLFDSNDRNLTRRILNNVCDGITNGWIGRQLPGMFSEYGLEKIDINTNVQVMTKLSENYPMHPVHLAKGVLHRQGITQAEADAWIQEQQQRMSEGRFLYSQTLFRVMGRKP